MFDINRPPTFAAVIKYGHKLSVYSWPTIIISLAVFFPLGLFLLCKRISIEKMKLVDYSYMVQGIGGALFTTCFVYVLALASGVAQPIDQLSFTASVFAAIICGLAVGGLSMLISKQMKIRGEEYLGYVACIGDDKMTALSDIGQKMNKSTAQVATDVKKLMAHGFFAGSYVDDVTGTIVSYPKDIYQFAPEVVPGTAHEIKGH